MNNIEDTQKKAHITTINTNETLSTLHIIRCDDH